MLKVAQDDLIGTLEAIYASLGLAYLILHILCNSGQTMPTWIS